MPTYRCGTQIGAGGFGTVYEAIEEESGLQCVVKYLKLDATPADLRRFQREVRLQLQLQHPNIMPILAFNLDTKPPFFVMPRAIMNLRQYILSNQPYEALSVFTSIVDGVAYAHANGVVHRDLKPENILLMVQDAQLLYVVADFGLGRKLDRDTTTITHIGMQLGSVAYMAPEQWQSAHEADARADVYSLGKLLYELVTRKLPHPTIDWTAIPRRLLYVIQRCLHDDPSKRYQSVAELLAQLRMITATPASSEKPADKLRTLLLSVAQNNAFEATDTEPIARYICENLDDQTVLIQVVPTIPDPILESLLAHHLETFRSCLEQFDGIIAQGLTFDYCDTVADFYFRVFQATEDFHCRRLVLSRLYELGWQYNRWHVGNVFGRIVGMLEDEALVLELQSIIMAQKAALAFQAPYLREHKIPQMIAELLPKPT